MDMTRTERRLIALVQERDRLRNRIAKAHNYRQSTKDLQARLVDATARQIRAEIAIERRRV